MVPDQLTFLTSQVVTLLHVGLAILSVPFVLLFVAAHRRHMAPLRRERPRRGGALEPWLLVATTALAAGTGAVVVAREGRSPHGHALHGWCGLAAGGALGAHLWIGRRRGAAVGVAALLLTATAGAWAARGLASPPTVAPAEFSFTATSSELYQPASYCGECHEREYAEWSRSTHGRTMVQRLVRDDMEAHVDELGFNLADYGAIASGVHHPHEDRSVGACERCHIPTDFYGDHRGDPRHPSGVAAEGITCSFCHSVRAIHEGEARGQPVEIGVAGAAAGSTPAIASRTDWPHILPRLPYYVAAPQSVHRYLGEGSKNGVLRWIANALIRWRPAMHRADYDSQVLRTSQACMPCHSTGDFDAIPELPQKTYFGWEHAGYPTSDPETQVTCQDCHMASQLTGLRSHERGPFVPWGPTRDGHVSHLMLGGNTTVAAVVQDADMEAREHELNRSIMDLAIVASRVNGSVLEVDLRAESKMVGHYLPSVATQSRYFWAEVSAQDESGAVLVTTATPTKGDEAGGDTPVIFRCVAPARPDCDTVLLPHQPRVFTARLQLPQGRRPARVSAMLHLSLDHQALLSVSAPVAAP